LPRNSHDEIKVEMQFTNVIDGSISGGYFLTIRLGNGLTLQGAMFICGQPSQIESEG